MPRTAGSACSRGSGSTARRSAAQVRRAASRPPVAFSEGAGALLRSRTRPPTRTDAASERAFRAAPARASQPGRRFTSGDGSRTRFAHRSCRGGRVAHRPAGLGQVDARNGARATAVRSRLAGLHARRRQCAPRPQCRSRFLAGGPAGEHPAHRRGGGAVRGRGDDLHHRVHLAVPGGPRTRACRCRSAAFFRGARELGTSRRASAAIRRGITGRRAPAC